MTIQKINANYLKQINKQFYLLLKELKKNKKFSQSAQIALLAYETFMDEIFQKINNRKLN